MKGLFLAICLFVGTAAVKAQACGSHSCEPEIVVEFGVPGFGSRPFFFAPPPRADGFFGRGGRAFRRSFRLQRMAYRAFENGNFRRAFRLEERSENAFARGVNRGGGFFIRPFWM